jgi:serine/threonine protein kinase
MTELKLQQCRLDNRYDIQECLGRGSYAEIYIARDIAVEETHPHAMVVIKALNLLLQGVTDEELERTLIQNFQNEAIALDRVRHPNIINRLGHGTAIDLSGTTFHYIVLEYLSGGDLAARCRKHPLTLKESLFYLEQVCAGLAHAHACHVIHRDIKPHNLLLTADGQTVKIADFGVAKIEATEGAITRVGTNVYAPPEHNPLLQTAQLESLTASLAQPHLTPAADIYSLAKTTYTLLAGEPPRRFPHRPITEWPESVAGHGWASSVLRVLERATQNNPQQRYQTVQEFWDELSEAAMPPTQILEQPGDADVRRRASDQLAAVGQKAVPEAPPRPRFDSTRGLKQLEPSANGNARPRIVVQLSEHESAQPHAPLVPNQPARDILAAMSDAPLPKPKVVRPKKDWATSRAVRFLVALLLIIAFAGMLLATHNYFRGRIPLWGNKQQNAPQTNNPPAPRADVGREGSTTTDLFLRSEPGTDNKPVGMAEKGSRVRVLNVNNNWYEVQILQHGRSTDNNGLDAEHGWVNKRYVNLDS